MVVSGVVTEVARELDRQVIAQENLTVFDTVVPGRFQTDKSGRLIYAEFLMIESR